MLWIVLGVIALLIVLLVLLYNRLVTLRNRVDNAWAQVDVQLKRRYDLIPNLVETVKGYAAHERGTFEAVPNARAGRRPRRARPSRRQAEGILSQALGRLFAVAEAYPELQADENFRQLQEELARRRTGSPSRARSTTTRPDVQQRDPDRSGRLLRRTFRLHQEGLLRGRGRSAREAPRVAF